jgi:hypothetical protein
VLANFTAENSKEIMESREQGFKESMAGKTHTIDFELDTLRYQLFEFKGYEVAPQQVSPLTGLKRFGYDLTLPYTKEIPFYTHYIPTMEVKIPEFYILPQAWKRVADRLEMNAVEFQRLKNDTTIEVEVYYIEEYSNAQRPYNGHYFHEKVTTRSEVQKINYYAGDLLIPVRQKKIKYLIETLEPKARDSFFKWNFFDQILDTREYFSSYGFEENAIKYLEEHPEFRKEFEKKRKNDPEFAKNHRGQLSYIYNNTEWAEETFKRYPVGMIFK